MATFFSTLGATPTHAPGKLTTPSDTMLPFSTNVRFPLPCTNNIPPAPFDTVASTGQDDNRPTKSSATADSNPSILLSKSSPSADESGNSRSHTSDTTAPTPSSRWGLTPPLVDTTLAAFADLLLPEIDAWRHIDCLSPRDLRGTSGSEGFTGRKILVDMFAKPRAKREKRRWKRLFDPICTFKIERWHEGYVKYW